MDNIDLAQALLQKNRAGSGQTSTVYGIATADSVDGIVTVDLGGDTVSPDDDQSIECSTTFKVYEGDEVLVSLIGADGHGKTPTVTGVVGRGDEQQNEIDAVKNYFWSDEYGAHVSTNPDSVVGNNILLDHDSLDIRYGNSDDESDQVVHASFGREVTVGSRRAGSAVGYYSQVFGNECSASGNYAHAEGYQSKADAVYAHAEGIASEAGAYSHAEGNGTYADNYSHAEGSGTYAEDYSHAEGMNTTASSYSHVEGVNCHADGSHSHAEGYGTKASSLRQHTQGSYNVEDKNNVYADIIGNGTDNNSRSNAYNMDWNGNAQFRGEVYVGGCSPNGQTPYPVVRYNTSLSRSEYYSGSGWSAVPGGGGGGGDSQFEAQSYVDINGNTVQALVQILN